jgi:glycosyltransferase involved in cell wall biosynthesis
MILISVVIPVLNEMNIIHELVTRVKKSLSTLTLQFEIILVDDGSIDGTWNNIGKECIEDERIKGLKLSRNFGQHYAITAGLHNAFGEWVVVMDGDLQDRPEVIPSLFNKAQEGFDVVFVSRKDRPESFWYMSAQKIFYLALRILSGIQFDSSQANFSIINHKVVEAFKKFPESARFYGSTIRWLGFKGTQISEKHGKRFSGTSSYNLKKRFKLASDVILAFSQRPLKFAIILGTAISFSSLFGAVWVLFKKVKWGIVVEGWASLIFSIFFLSGISLIVLGIIGIYLGQIFLEVKKRPLYIINDKLNIN